MPIQEPVVEPVAEPVAEPIAEPVAEPVAEPIAEPIAEPVAEPVAAPVAEPSAPPSERPTGGEAPVSDLEAPVPVEDSTAMPVIDPLPEVAITEDLVDPQIPESGPVSDALTAVDGAELLAMETGVLPPSVIDEVANDPSVILSKNSDGLLDIDPVKVEALEHGGIVVEGTDGEPYVTPRLEPMAFDSDGNLVTGAEATLRNELEKSLRQHPIVTDEGLLIEDPALYLDPLGMVPPIDVQTLPVDYFDVMT